MQQEIWKDIPGFPGYQASNNGNIRSVTHSMNNRWGTKTLKEGRILRQKKAKGYWRITIRRNGKKENRLVSRLVAMAFVPNPGNKPCIDHIDGDSLNNNISNLRWVTYKENSNNPICRKRQSEAAKKNHREGKYKELTHNSKPVHCFTITGEFIKTYPSCAEAGRQTGIRTNNISEAALGKKRFIKSLGRFKTTRSAGGYIWKYVD